MILSRITAARLWAAALPVCASLAVVSPLTVGVSVGWLAVSAPALAETVMPDHSADQVMTVAGQTMKARVYHSAKAERREMSQAGMKMISIVRRDKNVVWSLMPEQKMYMEVAAGADKGAPVDMSRANIQRTSLGNETLDGIKTNKNKVVVTDKASGTTMEGLMWETAEGILVKMDATGKVDGKPVKLVLQQSNIKVGPQPAALFEIPAGYTKMDMGAMGMPAGMGGGMGGAIPGAPAGMKGLSSEMMKGLPAGMMKNMSPEALKAMQEAMEGQDEP
jgi:hypothetical protein